MNPSDLYQQCMALIAEGRTEEALTLVRDNIDSLPEQLKGEILLASISDVAEDAAADETIAVVQEQGLIAIDTLEEARKEVEAANAA